MSAARKPPPPPDMGDLKDDWARLQDIRKQEASRDQEKDQEPAGEAPAPAARDAPKRQKYPPQVRPGRSRGGQKPPPAASDAVPTTVRFDPEEAREVTRFVLELQDAAGRRT
ncbi:hypothetical protein, partial [Streptomyces xanthochromogenes]